MESPTQHQVTCFGEILWDILPTTELPGGAPMNVAYHLKKLGASPALITRIGRDDYGRRLMDVLSGAGLTTRYIQEDSEQATGLVYAKPDEHNEVKYDIVFPSAWDYIEWREEYRGLLQDAEYFIYGSLAARHKQSRETLYQLLDVARTKVLDINLRPPHFDQSGLEYLLQKTNILKMNLAELELIASWYRKAQDIEDNVKILQDQFRLETIIVTLGGEGALVREGKATYRHPGFTIKVQDTIGSGDAFLAGFIHQRLMGVPVNKALEFACRIGAFVATRQGACPSYEVEQVRALMHANSLSGR